VKFSKQLDSWSICRPRCCQYVEQHRRFSDNISVDRLWRTLKYEKVYQNVAEAQRIIAAYFRLQPGALTQGLGLPRAKSPRKHRRLQLRRRRKTAGANHELAAR
jgi:hypothetical protein